MKRCRLILIGALLICFHSVASGAAGIYQKRDYRYSFDGMARDSTQVQTFVICEEGCVTAPYPARATRLPVLSVKASQNIAPGAQSTEKKPEGQGRETALEKDGMDGQRRPDTSTTILFDLDSALLNDVERAKLSSFAESIDPITRGIHVSVTGYTCDLGGKTHNDILADKRAEAVAAYLRSVGVHPFLVAGMGKCCYATNDPQRRHLNRRVEVRTGKKEVTK